MSIDVKTTAARHKSVRRALAQLVHEHPGAEFAIVGANEDDDECDISCATNVDPVRAVKLLGYAAEDFGAQKAKASPFTRDELGAVSK